MTLASSKYASGRDVGWLAEVLSQYRVAQADLARRTGLDPSYVSRGLTGQRKMRRDDYLAAVGELEGLVGPFATRWQEAAWRARLTSRELSEASGIALPRLVAILRGSGDPPSREETDPLEVALGLADAGMDGAGYPNDTPLGSHRGQLPDPSKAAGGIPILQAPEAADGGFLHLRKVVAELRRQVPPGLDGVSGAFGVFVGNDLLVPRWYAGEVIFLHPGRPLLAGRWLIGRLQGGKYFVGRITDIGGDRIEVDGLAPRHRLSVARSELLEAAVVVGAWSE